MFLKDYLIDHYFLVRNYTYRFRFVLISYTDNRVVHIKHFVIDAYVLQIPLKRHEAGESFDAAYRGPVGTDRLLDYCL